MPRGCKPKPKWNISGRRNQPKAPTAPTKTSPLTQPLSTGPTQCSTPVETSDDDSNSDSVDYDEWSLSPRLEFDSTTSGISTDSEDGDHSRNSGRSGSKCIEPEDWEECDDWEVGTEAFYVGLMRLAIDQGDDPRDEDWIPAELKKKQLRRKKGKHRAFGMARSG